MPAAFHGTLSEETVHLRYFGQLSLGTRTADDRLVRSCFADYDRERALVAEHETADGTRKVVGVGRLTRHHGGHEAEFALVLSDAWQNPGLGSRLLAALIAKSLAKKSSCASPARSFPVIARRCTSVARRV